MMRPIQNNITENIKKKKIIKQTFDPFIVPNCTYQLNMNFFFRFFFTVLKGRELFVCLTQTLFIFIYAEQKILYSEEMFGLNYFKSRLGDIQFRDL